MATVSNLTKKFPALVHTGTARMHFATLQKGAEILDDLSKDRKKTLKHVWGYDPNASNKEHHSGRALDFMVHGDKAAGDHIANYVVANAQRLGVVHIIWYQRIWRGPFSTSSNPKGVWQKMSDRGNSTQNHMDHPHVWFANLGYVAPPNVIEPVPTSLTKTLRRGDTGLEVELLQKMLNAVRGTKLDVDGDFGTNTEAAVVAAHKAWNVAAPHNVVGPGFRAVINKRWEEHLNPPPKPVDPPKVDPPKVDPPKVDPPKVDPPKVETPKPVVPSPPVVDPEQFSREELRQMLTGSGYELFKDYTATDPDTAPRIVLGKAVENAAQLALRAEQAALYNQKLLVEILSLLHDSKDN